MESIRNIIAGLFSLWINQQLWQLAWKRPFSHPAICLKNATTHQSWLFQVTFALKSLQQVSLENSIWKMTVNWEIIWKNVYLPSLRCHRWTSCGWGRHFGLRPQRWIFWASGRPAEWLKEQDAGREVALTYWSERGASSRWSAPIEAALIERMLLSNCSVNVPSPLLWYK